MLVSFIPVIGWLVLLYFMLNAGDAQDNRFGSNPKTA